MVKRIITFLMLFLVLFLLSAQTSTYASTTSPALDSPSAILMDAETGQTLYAKNENEKLYPASITKVLTAIVALEENKNLDEKVVVGENVPNQIESGSSAIYLVPGEILSFEQLMYALLIDSANDAAVTIAEHTSGSVEEFSKLMNEKAKELGATDSHFVNPHGLHSEQHYTTAHDMALIMKEAIKNPTLCRMMSTTNYVIPETNKQQARYLWTKNRQYKNENDEFYNDKVIASKTGYTTKANNTLVTAAENNDMRLITVILNAQGPVAYSDTTALFNYGFSSFKPSTLVHENDFIKEEKLAQASAPLKIVSRSTVTYLKDKSSNEDVKAEVNLSQDLPSSISKGQVIGKVEYTLGENKVGEAELIAGNDVSSQSDVYLQMVKDNAIILIPIGIALYVIVRIYVHIRNTKIRRRRIRKKYGITYKGMPQGRSSRRDQYN